MTGKALRRTIGGTVSRPAFRAAGLVVTVTGLAGAAAGPVAAALAGGYTIAVVLVLHRRRTARRTVSDRRAVAQAIGLLSADLRAGADPATAVTALTVGLPDPDSPAATRLRTRLVAIRRTATETGAPVTELLDRLAVELRQRNRLAGELVGQAAGARASAALLAALPAIGVALGEAIGAQPLAFLLHTGWGAGCAGLAAALQLIGLVWTHRLVVAAQPGTGW